MKKFRENKGQVMILTVVLLSGVLLSASSLAGLLILYQLRQAIDVKDSTQAIFAADAGLEWAYYNETRKPSERQSYPHTVNLSGGAKAIVTKDGSTSLALKSIGTKGRSARAFQANSPEGGNKLDIMLVLDRSGSIGSNLPALKAAAVDFVNTMTPTVDGMHIGVVWFETRATTDMHLSGDTAAITNAINAPTISGATNLSGGINQATLELDNLHIIHERPEVKDIILIITDGCPNIYMNNTGPGGACVQGPMDEAAGLANIARNAGSQIYTIGIGVNSSTTAYLQNRIADDAAHYFGIGGYSSLGRTFQTIAKILLATREVAPQ